MIFFKNFKNRIFHFSALIFTLLLFPFILSCSGIKGFLPFPKMQSQTSEDYKAEPLLVHDNKILSMKYPYNQPVQVTYETDPILHAAISPDGENLLYCHEGLWIRSANPNRIVLPKPVFEFKGDLFSPAFSPDGKFAAYSSTEYDVKGDIYVIPLESTGGNISRRLTGRDTGDKAPCFSPDGERIYFYQTIPGKQDRNVVFMNLGSEKNEIQRLETGGDAAFPAISPDNGKCVFVSNRNDPGGDLFLKDLQTGNIFPLTNGPEIDLYPAWSRDGRLLYFTRFAIDSNQDGKVTVDDNGAIYRINFTSNNTEPFPVTSSSYSAFYPMLTASKIYFLSTRKNVCNLFYLPLEGEIHEKQTSEAQYNLALESFGITPPDASISILAFYKVLEDFQEHGNYGAKSAYSIGRLYEQINMPDQAEKAYAICRDRFGDNMPEARLSSIQLVTIQYSREISQTVIERDQDRIIQEAILRLRELSESSDQAIIGARSLIEQARLLSRYKKDSQSLMESMDLLENVAGKKIYPEEQRAEAAYLRAGLLERAGLRDNAITALENLMEQFPGVGGWAEKAGEKILDIIVSETQTKDIEASIQELLNISERYQNRLPLLAYMSLNRIGDIWFEQGEWSQAKNFYRKVIDSSTSPSATTAARLSLAEILFREERFRETIDLYEQEMEFRPIADDLYMLARNGYIRKSISAATDYFRKGELAAARTGYFDLMQYDYSIVEAHRGYIQCASIDNSINRLLERYRIHLEKDPDNPIWLYSTGLCMTYLNTREALDQALEWINHAIFLNGQIEYFHQTQGYIHEVMETVYGKAGGLEAALEAYGRALFLNDPDENPENRANLYLNMGNIHFLLKNYQKAFDYYMNRLEAKVPFIDEDTELLFFRRLGEAAFQVRDREKPIMAYEKALELIEKRIFPKRTSELMGSINKYLFDNLIAPNREEGTIESSMLERVEKRQSDLNRKMFDAGSSRVYAPPDPSWSDYRDRMEILLDEQEEIIADLERLQKEKNSGSMETLQHLINRTRESLTFPEKLIELKAEMLDRLGLAYQETEKFRKAKETFEQVYKLNKDLGLVKNLVNNRRSSAYNAYLEAGTVSGEQRDGLLHEALNGFYKVRELVDQYGVAEKREEKGKEAVVDITLDISLDSVNASQAMRGFSAEQEKRIAQAFIHRILIELGELHRSYKVVEGQLAIYPEGQPVPEKDQYGVSLLFHRAGNLANAVSQPEEAFESFRRSAEMCLGLETIPSAAINIMNMAHVLSAMEPSGPAYATYLSNLLFLDRSLSILMKKYSSTLKAEILPSYHNSMGVMLAVIGQRGMGRNLEQEIWKSKTLNDAIMHFMEGLKHLELGDRLRDRELIRLNTALHLNMADISRILGDETTAKGHFQAALDKEKEGLFPEFRWRALAGLGSFDEALEVLESIPIYNMYCGSGEIFSRMSPTVGKLLEQGNLEAAFNMIERLSELERVGRMAPLLLDSINRDQRQWAKRIYPRILTIRQLENELAENKDGKNALTEKRLQQEMELLEGSLNAKDADIPDLVSKQDRARSRNSLIVLLGSAAHMEDLGDEYTRTLSNDRKISIKQEYVETAKICDAEKRLISETLRQLDAPGIMGCLIPMPVELIDLMEGMGQSEGVIARLFRLEGGTPQWAGFAISPDDFRLVLSENEDEFNELLKQASTIVCEDIFTPKVNQNSSVALNCSHLVRSIKNRKPFKIKCMVFPAGEKVPGTFSLVDLKGTDPAKDITSALPFVHTLLFRGPVYLGEKVATRTDESVSYYIAMGLKEDMNIPLRQLEDSLSNLSLAILPGASREDAYLTINLFSLFGTPTILLPEKCNGHSEFPGLFLEAYGHMSAIEAFRKSREAVGDKESWLIVGDRGVTPEEAENLAKSRFSAYVKNGVQAFKENNYGESLILMENAIYVVLESQDLRKYLPDLYRYAMESAFRNRMQDKAIEYAHKLEKLLSDTQWGSDAHAEALLKLGLLYAQKEKFDQAVPRLEEAASMMEMLDIGKERINAIANIGVVLENATEYERALEHFQSAASLSTGMGMDGLVALQKMRIGRIYDLRMSQYPQAIMNYKDALTIYTSLGQSEDMAQSLLDIGRCHRLLGNFTEAETNLDQAMELAEKHDLPERTRTRILMEKANNAWFQACYQEAFDLQRIIQNRAEKNTWLNEQVMSLNTSGLIWWSLGDYPNAVSKLNDALKLVEKISSRKDEKATTLNNLGLVYRDMERYEEALSLFDQALEIDRMLGSLWAIAYDLKNKAITYQRMGRPELALPIFEEAFDIAEKIGNRINQAKILMGCGDAFRTLKRIPEAEKKYNEALDLSRNMALKDTEWRALFGLARLDMVRGLRDNARARLEQAIDVIEGMRADIKLDQLKDGFVANKMEVYEALVSLLTDLGLNIEAFDVAERSRARNMIDLLGNQRLGLPDSVEGELLKRQKILRAGISEQEALLAGAETAEERVVYGGALERYKRDYKDLILEIQSRNPELASIVSVNPMKLGEIQALLEKDTALLSYYVLQDRIICWVIRSDSLEIFQSPVDRDELGRSILEYRRMLQNLEPIEEKSKELYLILFSMIEKKLEGNEVLGIIPHQSLHYLSFGTLFDGKDYITDRFPLFYLPSASVFQYTIERRKHEKMPAVLAIGNPDLDDPAFNLPFAEKEVSTIQWNFPDISILTGEKATESWVRDHIERFGVIHVASHGEFDPINPLFSSLKLTRDNNADGNLEASEVFNIRINADLVLLSACQTGLGKVTGGDDVIGMNRAFLYAGTHALISSLWRVSDISTAMLVKQFYREYVSLNKGESLRKAMLHVKNRYPHPGYWGAFVLVGDYE